MATAGVGLCALLKTSRGYLDHLDAVRADEMVRFERLRQTEEVEKAKLQMERDKFKHAEVIEAVKAKNDDMAKQLTKQAEERTRKTEENARKAAIESQLSDIRQQLVKWKDCYCRVFSEGNTRRAIEKSLTMSANPIVTTVAEQLRQAFQDTDCGKTRYDFINTFEAAARHKLGVPPL